jgi:hypothetical protein
MIQEITEKSDRATCDPEKGIPGLFPEVATIGSGASMQEGSTLKVIRLTHLQACPKKIIKKIVPKLFEQTMYMHTPHN